MASIVGSTIAVIKNAACYSEKSQTALVLVKSASKIKAIIFKIKELVFIDSFPDL